jgi:SAM-dependent methyltransferase
MSSFEWNERYKTGVLPWDTNEPDEYLVNLVRSGTVVPCRVLEIGCGTGTNSLWLASKGFSVLGVDISQVAIAQAEQKKEDKSLSCDFDVLDFLYDESLPCSFDFVFDRGCFHVYDKEAERSLFARQVSRVLKMNGMWISLIGSTEGGERETGPPRRTAFDIVKAVEPCLEIIELRSILFDDANHPMPPKAWLCMAKPRKEPAQPSTKR